MAAKAPAINEDDIDKLIMPKAVKLCRENKISLEGTTDLDRIRWLLKFHLLSKRNEMEKAMGCLSKSSEDDKTRKEALSTLYDDTIEYAERLRGVNDPVIEELNKMFPDLCENLEKERKKMMSDVAPVLVLGETGSGKSSFINLLLGQSILPCSLLSNTHVICEIRYCGEGKKSWAKLHKAGSDGGFTEVRDNDDKDSEEFTKELARYIQELDSNKRAVYKLAQIYLPCEILKSGLMIIDSPGIGETKEMTNMVLNYILNASAFIYIIDSTNAGGMQARVKELVQKVYRKALEEQKICRPESALFICNKWDEVSSKDRPDVWEDTRKKVKDVWPECKESQIICFSTAEAKFIQEKGGMAPKFGDILQSINSLVPVGQEILVLKGYRFIEHFISRSILCFEAHLSQLKFSQEERDQKQKSARDRLNQLKSKITSFFEEQTKKLKADIDVVADDLKMFINVSSNLEKVCRFTDSELPKRQTWNEAAVEVRVKVYESLRILIKEWEASETHFGGLANDIEKCIAKEFPALDKEIFQAEKLISNKPRLSSNAAEETEIGLVPEFIQDRIGGLSLGTKVALGIGLSPVLLVGMIFRLPVFGFQAFERFYSKYSLEKEFREAGGDREKLKLVCQKYAEKTVANITDKMNMRQVIEEDMLPLTVYLKQQQRRMEDQIQCDLDLLKNLKDEDRKDEDIKKVYEPLNAKFLILRERLHYFMLMHLPKKFAFWIEEVPFADIEMSHKVICSGLNAEIFQAKSNKLGTVCVRVVKEKIKENKMRRFLHVLEAYKTIKKERIAMCHGFWNPDVGMGKLHQVLEPLQCSLRQYTQNVDFQANHDNNCLQTMTQIISGLRFLHDRKLVHFDLSMDTVAISTDGKVKLTNISPEMRLNLEPEVIDGRVCISRYIHVAPEFFQNKDRVIYRVRNDMYGVGIIMWELWTGQPVVEIGKEFEVPESFFRGEYSPESTSSMGDNPNDRLSEDSRSDIERSSSTGSSKGGSDSGDMMKKNSRKRSKGSRKNKNEESDSNDAFEDEVKDRMWFQKYLETFQPKKTEHFTISNDKSRDQLSSEWWTTISACLDQNMSATDWHKMWKDYPKFPPVSIVFQEKHFSTED